ncbi:DAK2 domain-containing protein [Bacillus subtilis]|uniref:Protein YloV n=3 Tax=Bacillus subtilis subsp. subtilis TaxID=135461 RepID=YLOV_BACSU|nr:MULTISPECIES: DAK2 domain-containing protein [Bacillales]NP_389466.1 putative enzyme structurally related to dihydroxyacetone/glyceraldehyde kinase [Bacillus subtilis subsp. subtilis str. 168]O34751.1 RecName: Full=Protein YloV [Bacillus subtilis subsp. subtilis str. 168]MUG00283.1 DAK2 domain-containing protein [Bacillus tequilensis]BAM52230.1 dihydroxyacetone/glyceraldehyde kinase [Bacillus subtilis BEST7613]AFQ57520.1 Putative dihydroxyacetone/glyceraldehyde kinase [Bacillus subtilis QB9
MSIRTLDGRTFAEMILAGAQNLSQNASAVDALNVFPVPDGDTGTNMNLSMTSGAREVEQMDTDDIGKVGSALSKGLLMGARGNSGVILSQLFRGFSKNIETKKEINALEFAAALQAGVDMAYKAVMKPVEGTILTVAKDAAKKAMILAEKETDITALMTAVTEEAEASLNRTPELLPVLKEVGVVDSGGKGLLCVYEGFLASLKGETVPQKAVLPSLDDMVSAEHHKSAQSMMNTEDIEFGFCTEVMVRLDQTKREFDEGTFRQDLSQFGDSLLVIADESLAKVHIHAEEPGNVLNYAQHYGELIKIKIENMREQHTSIISQESKPADNETPPAKQPYGIVTVAMGEGIADLFKSIGASVVIEGGQTMNPSTEDIVDAVKSVNADTVFILPNNSNIIMAANQAASVVDEQVFVIPAKTVPQGMSALLAFNPDQEAEANEANMLSAIQQVKSGQVTFSVRDTHIDGKDIKKGDFMGILNGTIIGTSENQLSAAKMLLSEMIGEDDEIVTILYGEDASQEEAEQLEAFLSEKYEEIEVEIHNGKQPLYSYIVSAE